ncbi:hypothetical protein G9A89_011434 [Geosiphon pyriformis]|nr:hypothetical protein G9A89_011434 [Geosiphon pyriformis]
MAKLVSRPLLHSSRSFATFFLSSKFPSIFQRFSSTNVSRNKASSDASREPTEVIKSDEITGHVIPADAVSGAPEEIRYRTARIYKPSRTAMQSGTHGTKLWRLDFDVLEGGMWENPLMGWVSSADYLHALQMKFPSKEDAIHFAEKQGWDYYVQESKEPLFRVKSYANNYKYSPGKLRLIKTK